MLKKNVLGRAGLALACWGMALPQSGALAADRPAPARPAAAPAKPAILDVSLNSEGLLTGKVVNAQGKGLDGAAVTVRQGTREIAHTETASDGSFSVGGLRGGVYQVGAGQNTETFRVWTKKAAPPSARDTALIVSQPGVVRGQPGLGGGGGLGGVAGVGGLVAGGVGAGFGISGYNQANNAQDDADQANDQLQAYINSQNSSP